MIESAFYSILAAATSVVSLAGNRVYPLVVPTDSALPAIDYSFIGGSTTPTFTTTGTQKYRVEVNCWGATYSAAVSLRYAVIGALNGYLDTSMSIQLIQPRDFFDHDLLQYRAMVEFYVYATGDFTSAQGQTPAPVTSGDVMLSFIAATTISQYKAVTTSNGQAIVADTSVPTSAAIGIAATGASSGSSINVQCSGQISNPGWTWTDGLPIYVGPGGTLTQTSPTSTGFQQIVGYALSATSMVVDIQEQIIFG